MAHRTNSAEGGTNGVAVTAGNSGGASGTAFTTVNKNGAGAVTFDTAHPAHGTLAYHLQGPAAADTAYMTWGSLSVTAGGAFRVYIYMNALPSVGQDLVKILNNSSAIIAKIGISGTNKFNVSDVSGVVNTFTTAISAGTLYRIEIYVVPGTTTSNGTIKSAYFLGDAALGSQQDSVYNNSARNTGTVAIGSVQVGRLTATGTFDGWLDDYDFDDAATDLIGPFTTPTNPTAAFTWAVTGGNGLQVTFDGSGSQAFGGGVTITGYAWTFGDTGTGTGVGPSHTYSAGGTYTVQLTVTDSNGHTGVISHDITIALSSATAKITSVTLSTGWTVVNAADIATALSDSDPTSWALSADNPSNAELKCRLGSLRTPSAGTDMTVQVELDATGVTTAASAAARLYDSDGSTLRSTAPAQTLTNVSVGTAMVTLVTFTFPAADIANVTAAGWVNGLYFDLYNVNAS
jgi:PKD repeat protein